MTVYLLVDTPASVDPPGSVLLRDGQATYTPGPTDPVGDGDLVALLRQIDPDTDKALVRLTPAPTLAVAHAMTTSLRIHTLPTLALRVAAEPAAAVAVKATAVPTVQVGVKVAPSIEIRTRPS